MQKRVLLFVLGVVLQMSSVPALAGVVRFAARQVAKTPHRAYRASWKIARAGIRTAKFTGRVIW